MWINTLDLALNSYTKNMNVPWDLRKLKKKCFLPSSLFYVSQLRLNISG